ncbi:MAG: protein translocase subunit SecD [Bacilli bacterium]
MIKKGRLIAFILIVSIIVAGSAFTIKPVTDEITLGLDLQGGFEVLYQAKPTDGSEATNELLKDTVAAIQKRINLIGVEEPDIFIEKPDRIRVVLAGVENPDEAREKIGKTAELTFRDQTGKIVMRGTNLKKADVGLDPTTNAPVVTLDLKDASQFAQVTRDNLRKQVGIFLDEDMLSNPQVVSVIAGGQAVITGQGSVEEAQELAAILNAGSLPAELIEIQSNVVGASLGTLALQQSVKAGIIGAVIILIFMIAYYRVPGFVASIAMIGYVYMVLLTFSLLGVTLTLPGIAALILGMGMAVDANIITYERIREEMRSGKSVSSSIKAGSRRSLSTILDANITTLIAAGVLFSLGTGSVNGFAVALIVNILISIVTNVLGSRSLLNLLVRTNLFNKPSFFGVRGDEIREL